MRLGLGVPGPRSETSIRTEPSPRETETSHSVAAWVTALPTSSLTITIASSVRCSSPQSSRADRTHSRARPAASG